MSKGTTSRDINLVQDIVRDELTEFIRGSAVKMIQVAVEAEVGEFIAKFKDSLTMEGKQRVVRNGYLPSRDVQTGIGSIPIKMPRVRDREPGKQAVNFSSYLVPKYMRRTVTLDVMLPLLYLKGVSTNEFGNVLSPMLGSNAKAISPGVISSLKKTWYEEYQRWSKRDLSSKRYVYLWADGVYLKARMNSDKNCILVIIGSDEHGNKEIVAISDGFRESKESWCCLLRDLKERGLTYEPHLAVGDGALGFWGAMTELYPKTKHQRCWVHKTANVLDKMPKSLQSKAKSMLHDIYLAETKKQANKSFDKFISKYSDKYNKATACLEKDRNELMSFYDFPASHWQHIRTTNPIESTFATVKHRTRQSRGCFSRETIIASTFKLLTEAGKRWKRLRGYKQLADVINLVKFIDGIDERKLDQLPDNEVAA